MNCFQNVKYGVSCREAAERYGVEVNHYGMALCPFHNDRHPSLYVADDHYHAVPTTDWGSPETLEHWRQAWADLCNAKFAEKDLGCRIDHRSYERQGIEQIPTVHEGPSVRAMEAKGIRTDKGDFNRWVRKTNAMLREAKNKIASLLEWLKTVKEGLSKPQPPMLNDLLICERVCLIVAVFHESNAGGSAVRDNIVHRPIDLGQIFPCFSVLLFRRHLLRPPRNVIDAIPRSGLSLQHQELSLKIRSTRFQNAVLRIMAFCSAHGKEVIPSRSNRTLTPSSFSSRMFWRQSLVLRAKREIDLTRIWSIRPRRQSAIIRWKSSRLVTEVPVIPSSA